MKFGFFDQIGMTASIDELEKTANVNVKATANLSMT